MWQRYQTLLLAVATLLIVSLFWCDLSRTVMADGIIDYVKYTDKTIFKVWLIILTVLHVLALGGFKWRMKQFRVVVFTALVTIGFQIWLAVYFFQTKDTSVMSWTALFPLLAAGLDAYAARNILLDEFIVQSANRLRGPRKKKKQ